MDTNLLKYRAFVLTAEYKSFTIAGEKLCYSQSGISRMIRDLEREWDVVLLERSRGGVFLTADGSALLPYARNLCEEYDRLKTQLDAMHGLMQGTIRIGTFSSVATHWLPGIIRAFQRDYPGIDYELLLGDYSEIETWIDTGRVDCGFLRLRDTMNCAYKILATDRLLSIVPMEHPLAALDKIPLSCLCSEPFLLLEKGGKEEISELFERYSLTPKVRFTTWDDYAIMSMVEQGLGVSILPELILQRLPYRIAIRELKEPASRTIVFAVKNMAHISLAARAFMNYLDQRTEENPG